MRPDLSYAGRVGGISLKRDAPAIVQRLETMEGGVLIYAHGSVAAGLD
jgi:hypothetical protein